MFDSPSPTSSSLLSPIPPDCTLLFRTANQKIASLESDVLAMQFQLESVRVAVHDLLVLHQVTNPDAAPQGHPRCLPSCDHFP